MTQPTQSSIDTMVQCLTSGGDERIVIDPATGLNRYHSSPVPTDGLVLASSTANDLSASGQAFLQDNFAAEAHSLTSGAAYEELLDRFRQSIRSSYGLGERADVFFAPSGTDLEYVGLLAAAGRRAGGIANFLLGADEIGSGCIHSAAGHYFAQQTALDVAVKPGQPVKGLPPVTLWDLPIRCEMGLARQSDALLQEMEKSIVAAQAQDQFPLLHIVHGSKTGLVLPTLDHVDALINRFGSGIGFVVDACQARITQQAVRDYLDREIIVFITGSKFMGGPPFSGFALVPDGLAASSHPIPEGMADVFRRGEIPSSWPGREFCSDTGNPGLALRLAASLYELERFQNLEIDRIRRVVSAFTAATEDLARTMDVRKVASAPAGHAEEIAEHPIEMQTLVTIDLTRSRNGEHLRELTFDDAQAMHCALVPLGIRLGQPVRCVRLRNGDWGATLRIGISMPQATMLDAMDDDQMHQWLGNAMDRIGRALAEMLER